MSPRTQIATLCLLYAVVLGIWEPPTGQLVTDYRSFYRPVALQIIDGQGFAFDGHFSARYPPGYPLILAPVLALAGGTGISERFMLLALDLICLLAGALLLRGIACRLTGERLAALPVWLWVTYPPVVFGLGRGLTEFPFSVALFGMVLMLLSGRWPAVGAAGLICGAAMLIRPAGFALLIGAAIWLLAFGPPWRPRLARVGAFVCAAVLVILPWEIFTYAHTGKWVLLSTGGRSSVLDGLTQGVRQKNYRVAPERNEQVLSVERRVAEASPQLAGIGDIASFMAMELRQNPLAVLHLFAIKAGRAWFGTDSMRYEGYLLAMQVPYLALSLLGAGILIHRGGDLQTVLLLLFLVVCSWGLAVVVLSILRYMVPAMGLLFVCATGLAGGTGFWRRRE